MNPAPVSRARLGVPAGPAAPHTVHQFRLPFDAPSPPDEVPSRPPGSAAVHHDPVGVAPVPTPVSFVRHARARRYVLRVEPDGSVRVTVPRSGSRREAEAFLARSQAWVDRQRLRLRSGLAGRSVLTDGGEVLVAGIRTRIAVSATASGLRVRVGEIEARGGHAADVRAVVMGALRGAAERDLPGRLHELAAQSGLTVRRVSIRNQKGRWGSCSPSGTISLNWRLVQVPPEVRDYVLIHELMHLREANHSRRFWRHVARACPTYAQSRRWLLDHGNALL